VIFCLDIFVIVFNWEFNGGSMPSTSIEFDHMIDGFVQLVIYVILVSPYLCCGLMVHFEISHFF